MSTNSHITGTAVAKPHSQQRFGRQVQIMFAIEYDGGGGDGKIFRFSLSLQSLSLCVRVYHFVDTEKNAPPSPISLPDLPPPIIL